MGSTAVIDPAVPLPVPFRVTDKRRETQDTWTLALEPVEERVAPLEPGQFAMLYAFGAGEVPISTSGPLVHTVRAVGAVTGALCRIEVGGTLGVRGPYGVGWPVALAEGRDVVVAAGGIGLAPLRPVIHELIANRERYGEVNILYGGRSPGELLFVEELEQWRSRFDISVDVTVDGASAGWHGRVGVVTALVSRATFDPVNTIAMMCGPEVMMRFVAAALRERGMADDAIWLSLERSMKCAVGHCGHCQLGPLFVCRDGPVVRLDRVEHLMRVREL
jgi:NAD(P)H-flavin reductase